jgi:hypothetical protein
MEFCRYPRNPRLEIMREPLIEKISANNVPVVWERGDASNRLPVQIAPKRLLGVRQEMLEAFADRCYFRHRV